MNMKAETSGIGITKGMADTMAFSVLDNSALKKSVRGASKLSIEGLRHSLGRAIVEAAAGAAKARAIPTDPVEVHRRLLRGLPGEAMFIASAMAFDTFKEGEAFFGLTAKTARQRIGKNLDPTESEKALRLARALGMATQALGDVEEAIAYLRTPNFALGGMAPRELLQTAEGEQLVLNEIQAQADGGPV